ncbi:hypothetical protein ACIP5Z_02080 [Rothia terrae]|uniref:hypothetical protein n=1 Tax=Rothia terrae TaxID=396015 RepID=UPI00380AE4BC
MGWKVYALRTLTGEVGSCYDPVDANWTITLNKIEEFSVTIKKRALLNRERLWFSPWGGGVLMTYTDAFGREEPIVAGPIIDYGYETVDEITFECAGIRSIFEHRTVEKNLEYKDMTYGDIAWALVQHGMDKIGGQLPIIHGIPAESGRYQRTYEAWNLANNQIDKRLTELSEVIMGPDIMFRPRWADDSHTRIQWVLMHGTSLSTNIPQQFTPDFDTTVPVADIGLPSIASSAAMLTNRVWVTGAGEGEGIERVKAENFDTVRAGYPFLETVQSNSDVKSSLSLQQKADGSLLAGRAMIDQVTFTLRANSRKHPVTSYFVGDTANVTLEGWLNIPDGMRSMKILRANGDLSDAVQLAFQEGVWQ